MPEGIDWLNELDLLNNKQILCLVDGEHYPPVTEWALKSIEERGGNICGLVFAGGTEKITRKDHSLFSSTNHQLYIKKSKQGSFFDLLKQVIQDQKPDLMVDLSDVPVVDFRKRFKIASLLLEQGITYAGADFLFTPPTNDVVLTKPSITIFGTGKRVGKTAVSITVSRTLKQHGIQPAVVAMGRGGPPEPQIVLPEETEISPDFLLEVTEQGDHAASDYWENALLADIPSIGCRRCGGGLAGNPMISNVMDGARKASELPVDLVIMEGSGPTLPPVKTDSKITVVGAQQPAEEVATFFDEFRLLSSDLVIVTMCEKPTANAQKIKTIENTIKKLNPDTELALTVFRPDPLGDIKNKKVFLATTAPDSIINQQIKYLEQEFECKITGYSTNLSNRKLLEQDLQQLDSAEVLLTEVKAASVDVAAKAARNYNKDVVFLHNRIELVGGTVSSLEKAIMRICERAGLQPSQKMRPDLL